MPKHNGAFIVIEGIDAAGTTTQVSQVAESLEAAYENGDSHPSPVAHTTKEPTDGPIGGTIRTAISDRLNLNDVSLALLFAADRIDHIRNTVQPLLEDGHIVISDRYYLSSFAYQQTHEEMCLDWIRTINKHALTPDLTIFLDITAEQSLERMSKSRPESTKDKFEARDQLEKIRDNYLTAIEVLSNQGENIVRIDGYQGKDAVHEGIVATITEYLEPEINEA